MFGRRMGVLSLLLLIYILGAFPKDYLNWFYRDLDYNVLHGLEVCRAALSLQENSKSAIEVYVVIPTQLQALLKYTPAYRYIINYIIISSPGFGRAVDSGGNLLFSRLGQFYKKL